MILQNLVALWERASASKLGIAVETDNRGLLSKQLYRARQEHGGFDDIKIVFPRKEDELWLVKQKNP